MTEQDPKVVLASEFFIMFPNGEGVKAVAPHGPQEESIFHWDYLNRTLTSRDGKMSVTLSNNATIITEIDKKVPFSELGIFSIENGRLFNHLPMKDFPELQFSNIEKVMSSKFKEKIENACIKSFQTKPFPDENIKRTAERQVYQREPR